MGGVAELVIRVAVALMAPLIGYAGSVLCHPNSLGSRSNTVDNHLVYI